MEGINQSRNFKRNDYLGCFSNFEEKKESLKWENGLILVMYVRI
jgi:hypothetical protein